MSKTDAYKEHYPYGGTRDEELAFYRGWDSRKSSDFEQVYKGRDYAPSSSGINDYVTACHEVAKSKGWWDKARSFAELMALLHSEVSETFEAFRDGAAFTHIYYTADKPEGIPIELADVAIRLFDMCGYYGIDLEEALQVKMAYNKTREYRHGGKQA